MDRILIFLGGISVGSVGVFLLLRRDYRKKIEEETEQIRMEADKKDDQIDENGQKNDEKTEPVDVMAAEKMSIKMTNGLKYTNYADDIGKNRMRNSPDFEEIEENSCATFENKSGALEEKSGASEQIYGISDEDFIHSNRHFEKCTLVFYEKNEVFTDECATFCANAPLLVGEKWRMEIGKYEDNVAYIRNEKIGTDFEVIVENSAFELPENNDLQGD